MTTGVFKAINKVQSQLAKTGIAKERSGTGINYKFRGIDDIYGALAPLLAESGLTIVPRVVGREVTERTTKSGTAMFYVTVEAEYIITAAEDGSQVIAKVYGEAMDTSDKATNKAMSAAYKYLCLQTFCIPTEGDNDADAVKHEVLARPPLPDVSVIELDNDQHGLPDVPEFARALKQAIADAGSRDELTAIWKAHKRQLARVKDLSQSVHEEINKAFAARGKEWQ